MARDRSQVQADFLNTFFTDNGLGADEFYTVLNRLEDHPLLANVRPSLRQGDDRRVRNGELGSSYLEIHADYTGGSWTMPRDNQGVQQLLAQLSIEGVSFIDGAASWYRLKTGGYVGSEIMVSDKRVPVHIKVEG